jgi:replicative DNA helicase
MTSKDFKQIAAVLKDTKEQAEEENDGGLTASGVETVMHQLALMFEMTQPAFDRQSFLLQCGL